MEKTQKASSLTWEHSEWYKKWEELAKQRSLHNSTNSQEKGTWVCYYDSNKTLKYKFIDFALFD
jgi:hypothetical protein